MKLNKNIDNEQLKKNWKDDWNRIKRYKKTDRTHHDEVRFIFNNIDKIETFLDCGPGTVGSEAWSVNDLNPNCKIIGIEPQKERYSMLKIENYPGELHNCAIGDSNIKKKGYTGFAEGKSDFWAIASKDLLEIGAYRETIIDFVTIDNIIGNYKNVFVWADIEGSEYNMIKGAINNMIQGNILGFFLEIHKESSPDYVEGQGNFNDIENILFKYGFTKKIKYSDKGTHEDWLFLKEVKK